MADIELRNLTKRFGDLVAVDSVDLDVEAGEVMCLLGPSGCGKTTTLRMIGGLEWATEGDIFIAGKLVNNLKPAQRDIAMVFQFYALYPSLTVTENLAFPLHAEKVDKAEIERRVTRIARILELDHALNRIPGRLSEGEKQRVAVGRAIIRNPQCFLFDEPLSRLDIALRQEMRGQIKMLLADLNKASVIVTHDQIEALTIGDRIAVMRDGLIEQVASPHEIFASPANVFVAGFIGTPQMNLIAGRSTKPGGGGGLGLSLCNQDIALPLAPDAAAAGAEVTVGVRPRGFDLASESAADTLSGRVDLIEPMGAETLLHLKTEAEELRVVTDHRSAPAHGANVHVRPRAGQIHLFDEHGGRIGA
ncbi:MAG: ABC transporter ATP-binding protein [Alphaproteobacteria bacterium]|jgi:ABC-type sugar transport system ATPase subunit|nr:ABC transporter ATP-binding protein [Rhodospirillales bacterium]MDP6591402.1 ABC transporter ATP-binding protein [Alphaproteobacteria bacterium]MDP6817123.1 ABC transporter ATP-binding protein [Alphaproteobacteria bacterium]|tara:strand:+ start:2376 stop:3461 length:1086 start_codon:yes stop_codon:yes gene_type:complete